MIWCLCCSSLRSERRKRQAFDSGRNNILGFPADSLSDDFSDGLQNVDITSLISAPLTSPDCDSPDDKGPCDVRSQFRTITGRCNNLRNPNLGKSISTFARLLPASYEDSKWILCTRDYICPWKLMTNEKCKMLQNTFWYFAFLIGRDLPSSQIYRRENIYDIACNHKFQ